MLLHTRVSTYTKNVPPWVSYCFIIYLFFTLVFVLPFAVSGIFAISTFFFPPLVFHSQLHTFYIVSVLFFISLTTLFILAYRWIAFLCTRICNLHLFLLFKNYCHFLLYVCSGTFSLFLCVHIGVFIPFLLRLMISLDMYLQSVPVSFHLYIIFLFNYICNWALLLSFLSKLLSFFSS